MPTSLAAPGNGGEQQGQQSGAGQLVTTGATLPAVTAAAQAHAAQWSYVQPQHFVLCSPPAHLQAAPSAWQPRFYAGSVQQPCSLTRAGTAPTLVDAPHRELAAATCMTNPTAAVPAAAPSLSPFAAAAAVPLPEVKREWVLSLLPSEDLLSAELSLLGLGGDRLPSLDGNDMCSLVAAWQETQPSCELNNSIFE
jgi:hypothetical protein